MQKSIQIHMNTGADVHPVAMLVQIANKYESKIYLKTDSKNINAKSIMGVMSMSLNNGTDITVSAEGADEEQALNAIADYLSGEKN